MNYEKYLKTSNLLKKKYGDLMEIFIKKIDVQTVGTVEEDFENYLHLLIKRPNLMEFNLIQKYIKGENAEDTDFVSIGEIILNNLVVSGDVEIIKKNDDYFVPLFFSTSFIKDFMDTYTNSMKIRKVYVDTITLDTWVSKEDVDFELTFDYIQNNLNKFDHFRFRKISRNELRNIKILEELDKFQMLLMELCIEGDKMLIMNEDVFFSLNSSKIVNLISRTTIDYIKKK